MRPRSRGRSGGGWVWQVLLGVLVADRARPAGHAAARRPTARWSGTATASPPGAGGCGCATSSVATAIDAGLTALGLLALVWLARRAPRTWWAWGALGAAALVVVGSFLWPVVIEPAFNRFEPMPAGQLRTRPAGAGRGERHPGAGRAGLRRLPADDGAQRLRVRLRVDPADRRLRHGARAAARRRDRVDRRPRARPRGRRTTCSPARSSARSGRPRRRGRCSAGCCPRPAAARRAGADSPGDPRIVAAAPLPHGRRHAARRRRCRTSSPARSRPGPTCTPST